MNSSELPCPDMFLRLAEQHGHYCPMSTLGVRIGWAAQRRLVGVPESVSYRIQTCAVDGIRLVLDFDAVQVEAQNRHQLQIADLENEWVIELRPAALDLAASYRLLDSDSEREALLEKLRSTTEASLLAISQSKVAR